MFFVDLIIFLLVLGLLIFVHELGHFAAAKSCGVYCNRFSLGMPPRLFGIKIGETDYCIGAVPFGGYVKMAGQEDAPMTEEEREKEFGHIPSSRWLCNRPMWQRFYVFAAGPAMNFVLAVALYALLAATGAEILESQIDSRVGAVAPGSPAAAAPMFLLSGGAQDAESGAVPDAVGWETGDRIVSVDGKGVTNITDVAICAALGGAKPLRVIIERKTPEGGVQRFVSRVMPRLFEGEDLPRFGIEAFDAAEVKALVADMPAASLGIAPGDVITRAGGKWVDITTFIKTVESVPEGGSLDIVFARGEGTFDVSVQPQTRGRFLDIHFVPWEPEADKKDDAHPQVALAAKELTAKTGIRSRDIVLEMDGRPATIGLLRAFETAHPGQRVTLTLRRPAVLFGLLRGESTESAILEIASVRAAGIELGPKMVFHRVPPAQVLPQAFRDAYQDFARTVRTLDMLVTGELSLKNLGGPVMIGQVVTRAAREGYWWFLRMTAFISVNLFVFNLLPLPILDGGQIVLLALEGVRRKPVSMRFAERFQQVGLVLIVGLMLFVTYNDVLRWLKSLVN